MTILLSVLKSVSVAAVTVRVVQTAGAFAASAVVLVSTAVFSVLSAAVTVVPVTLDELETLEEFSDESALVFVSTAVFSVLSAAVTVVPVTLDELEILVDDNAAIAAVFDAILDVFVAILVVFVSVVVFSVLSAFVTLVPVTVDELAMLVEVRLLIAKLVAPKSCANPPIALATVSPAAIESL